MTADELAKLTDEEKRVKIAGAHFPEFPTFWQDGELRHRYPDGRSGPAYDYLNDLNAMRDAEQAHLQLLIKNKYWSKLMALEQPVKIEGEDRYELVGHWNATAAQHADAFLLCI